MVDRLYDLIRLFSSLAEFTLEAFYLCRFYQAVIPVEDSRRRNCFFLIPAGYVLALEGLKIMPAEMDPVLANAAGIMIVFLLSYLIFNGNTQLKLYICVTFLSVKYLVYSLFLLFNEGIYRWISRYYAIFYNKGYEEEDFVYLVLFLLHVFLVFLIRWLIFHLVIHTIVKCYLNKTSQYNVQELLFLSVPSVSGILWGLLISRFFVDVTGDIKKPEWLFLIAGGTLVFVAGIAVNTVLLLRVKREKEKEKEYILLHRQMESMSAHIEKVEQLYEGMQGIRHDIKNHLFNIKNLLQQGETEELNEYIRQFEAVEGVFDLRYKTGNPVTDVIISESAQDAEKKGISFQSDFYFPIHTKMNAFDISIIVQNALENALEACAQIEEGKDKHILLRCMREKNVYLIQVRNSFHGEMILNGRKLPVTTKDDKLLHGIGLKNMKQIADKYYGDIELECKNGEFVMTAMLLCK